MTLYVALLRGITPSNPLMRNENLRQVCEELGFTNVSTVISTGNLVFEATGEAPEIEEALERAWFEKLGFESTTILRSREELSSLDEAGPFGALVHGKSSYLLTTFVKTPMSFPFEIPHEPAGGGFEIISATSREVFSVSDTTVTKTPDVMSWLQSQLGPNITSRTWLTVQRILKKMA